MKKQLYLLFVAAMLMIFPVITGCSESGSNTAKNETEETTASESQQSEKEKAPVEDTATIKIQDGENVISEKEIVIEEGNNLLQIMKDNFKIEEKDNFITSIEGVKQSEEENKYWVFEINGEPIMEGAHLTEVKKDDQVVWKLEKF